MYVKNFRELLAYIINVFKEKRFWFSIKYIFWCIWDRIRGVDYVKNESHNVLNTDAAESSVFQATRDIKYLKNVLDRLEITDKDSILDLGSGKGYLLKVFATDYDFRTVGGVEISSRLAEISRKNLEKEGIGNFQIFNENATTFYEYGGYNYIYMFNPFPSVVMKSVMKNIDPFVRGGAMCIIYRNPVCHDDIINSRLFYLDKVFQGKTSDYYLYRSK